MNSFEDFLMEKHADQFIGTKDVMIDDFPKWFEELDMDEIIKLGQEYGDKRRGEFDCWKWMFDWIEAYERSHPLAHRFSLQGFKSWISDQPMTHGGT